MKFKISIILLGLALILSISCRREEIVEVNNVDEKGRVVAELSIKDFIYEGNNEVATRSLASGGTNIEKKINDINIIKFKDGKFVDITYRSKEDLSISGGTIVLDETYSKRKELDYYYLINLGSDFYTFMLMNNVNPRILETQEKFENSYLNYPLSTFNNGYPLCGIEKGIEKGKKITIWPYCAIYSFSLKEEDRNNGWEVKKAILENFPIQVKPFGRLPEYNDVFASKCISDTNFFNYNNLFNNKFNKKDQERHGYVFTKEMLSAINKGEIYYLPILENRQEELGDDEQRRMKEEWNIGVQIGKTLDCLNKDRQKLVTYVYVHFFNKNTRQSKFIKSLVDRKYLPNDISITRNVKRDIVFDLDNVKYTTKDDYEDLPEDKPGTLIPYYPHAMDLKIFKDYEFVIGERGGSSITFVPAVFWFNGTILGLHEYDTYTSSLKIDLSGEEPSNNDFSCIKKHFESLSITGREIWVKEIPTDVSKSEENGESLLEWWSSQEQKINFNEILPKVVPPDYRPISEFYPIKDYEYSYIKTDFNSGESLPNKFIDLFENKEVFDYLEKKCASRYPGHYYMYYLLIPLRYDLKRIKSKNNEYLYATGKIMNLKESKAYRKFLSERFLKILEEELGYKYGKGFPTSKIKDL